MSKPPSAPTRDSASLSQPSFFAPAGSDSSGIIPKTCREALNSSSWLHSLHSLVPLWWLLCLPLSLPSVWVLGFHPFQTWGEGEGGGVGRVAIFCAVRLPVSATQTNQWSRLTSRFTERCNAPSYCPRIQGAGVWTISVGWKQTRQFSGLQCLTSIRRWGSATCRAFCAAFLVGVLASTVEDLWTSLERWPCFFHCVLVSFCRGSGIPPFFSKFPRRVSFGASVSLLVCVLAVVVSCAPS